MKILKEWQITKRTREMKFVCTYESFIYIACCILLSMITLQSFRAGDFEESLEYYTTSLSFHQTVAVLTNRALACKNVEMCCMWIKFPYLCMHSQALMYVYTSSCIDIKLKRYQNAITDCEKALSMEPNNVKGRCTFLCKYLEY